MLLFSHWNSTRQPVINTKMFLLGHYAHTSDYCKMAQPPLDLVQIYPRRELDPTIPSFHPSITPALKSHLTPGCLRHLDVICSNFLLDHKLTA